MKCLYLTTVRPSHGILFRRVFLCHHVMSENVSSNSSSIQAQKCCLFHSAKWNHLSVELTTYVECPPIWFVDKIDNVLLLSLARFIDGLKYLRSFFIRENRFYFKKYQMIKRRRNLEGEQADENFLHHRHHLVILL